MILPTQPKLDCTAILMAGGKSSRMGRDKAWIDYHGRPLWQAQLEKLGFAREILISTRAAAFTAPGCRVVRDDPGHSGPLAGLHACLKAATCDRVLLLAVDMPEMTSGHLRALAENATPEVGVVPEADGFYQGLAAVYPRRILPLLEEILSSTDTSFQNLCRQAFARGLMKAQPISPEEECLFTNWNRPEDLA